VPVAAFPVTGPKDVIGDAPVGALDNDLRRACLAALEMSRQACRQHALQFSWTASATQFLDHVSCVATSAFRSPQSERGMDAEAGAVLGSLGSVSRTA
jgi:hypothetical protein